MEQEVPEDEAGAETDQAQGQTMEDIVIHVPGCTLLSSVVLESRGSVLAGHGCLRSSLRKVPSGGSGQGGWKHEPLGRGQGGCYHGLERLQALTGILVVELGRDTKGQKTWEKQNSSSDKETSLWVGSRKQESEN